MPRWAARPPGHRAVRHRYRRVGGRPPRRCMRRWWQVYEPQRAAGVHAAGWVRFRRLDLHKTRRPAVCGVPTRDCPDTGCPESLGDAVRSEPGAARRPELPTGTTSQNNQSEEPASTAGPAQWAQRSRADRVVGILWNCQFEQLIGIAGRDRWLDAGLRRLAGRGRPRRLVGTAGNRRGTGGCLELVIVPADRNIRPSGPLVADGSVGGGGRFGRPRGEKACLPTVPVSRRGVVPAHGGGSGAGFADTYPLNQFRGATPRDWRRPPPTAVPPPPVATSPATPPSAATPVFATPPAATTPPVAPMAADSSGLSG